MYLLITLVGMQSGTTSKGQASPQSKICMAPIPKHVWYHYHYNYFVWSYSCYFKRCCGFWISLCEDGNCLLRKRRRLLGCSLSLSQAAEQFCVTWPRIIFFYRQETELGLVWASVFADCTKICPYVTCVSIQVTVSAQHLWKAI